MGREKSNLEACVVAALVKSKGRRGANRVLRRAVESCVNAGRKKQRQQRKK